MCNGRRLPWLPKGSFACTRIWIARKLARLCLPQSHGLLFDGHLSRYGIRDLIGRYTRAGIGRVPTRGSPRCARSSSSVMSASRDSSPAFASPPPFTLWFNSLSVRCVELRINSLNIPLRHKCAREGRWRRAQIAPNEGRMKGSSFVKLCFSPGLPRWEMLWLICYTCICFTWRHFIPLSHRCRPRYCIRETYENMCGSFTKEQCRISCITHTRATRRRKCWKCFN